MLEFNLPGSPRVGRHCNAVTAEQISCVLGWLTGLVFKAVYLGQQHSATAHRWRSVSHKTLENLHKWYTLNNKHFLSWMVRYAEDVLSHSSSQLPDIVGCTQRHLRKTYFYTCESGGKEWSGLKLKPTGVIVVHETENMQWFSQFSSAFCLWSSFKGRVVTSVKLTMFTFLQQYEVKRNWIFVPSATASSSDHDKETED